jgi:inner membrane transporter RhtA
MYVLTRVDFTGQALGLLLAFANASLFALYIILAHRLAASPKLPKLDGLAAAMLVSAICITPVAGGAVVGHLLDPIVIGAGVGVGVASSVIPYVFDQLAMARLPRATFALFVSLLPAVATVAGLVVLGQVPSVSDLLGIGTVTLAIAVHRPAPDARSRPQTLPATHFMDASRANCPGTSSVFSDPESDRSSQYGYR